MQPEFITRPLSAFPLLVWHHPNYILYETTEKRFYNFFSLGNSGTKDEIKFNFRKNLIQFLQQTYPGLQSTETGFTYNNLNFVYMNFNNMHWKLVLDESVENLEIKEENKIQLHIHSFKDVFKLIDIHWSAPYLNRIPESLSRNEDLYAIFDSDTAEVTFTSELNKENVHLSKRSQYRLGHIPKIKEIPQTQIASKMRYRIYDCFHYWDYIHTGLCEYNGNQFYCVANSDLYEIDFVFSRSEDTIEEEDFTKYGPYAKEFEELLKEHLQCGEKCKIPDMPPLFSEKSFRPETVDLPSGSYINCSKEQIYIGRPATYLMYEMDERYFAYIAELRNCRDIHFSFNKFVAEIPKKLICEIVGENTEAICHK